MYFAKIGQCCGTITGSISKRSANERGRSRMNPAASWSSLVLIQPPETKPERHPQYTLHYHKIWQDADLRLSAKTTNATQRGAMGRRFFHTHGGLIGVPSYLYNWCN